MARSQSAFTDRVELLQGGYSKENGSGITWAGSAAFPVTRRTPVSRWSSMHKPTPRLSRQRLLRLIGLIVVLVVAGLLRERFPDRPSPPAAEAWTIQKVHDGDTVTAVAADGRKERIRLLGIDAPEYSQPHGRVALTALERKVEGHPIRLEPHGRDQYDRLLGTLWIDQRNLNLELVAEGHAWVFDRFTPPADLQAAQQAARRNRRGLWAADDPLRPSDWREAHPRRP